MELEESQILKFYRGEGNRSGHLLKDIIEVWDDDDWERIHDYIQWVFPTDEESRFHPDAPTMTEEEAGILGKDPELRGKMLAALERFKKFLKLDGGPYWWATPNHNLLRISRVIRCLALVGLQKEANEMRDACSAILKMVPFKEEDREVTLHYWEFNSQAYFGDWEDLPKADSPFEG